MLFRSPGLEDIIEPDDDAVLVLKSVELADAWRGFGLGPLIAAHALRRLSPGCGVVLVHPSPIDASGMTSQGLGRARQRLRETWATLGFVSFGDSPYMFYATCWEDPVRQQRALHEGLNQLSAQWHKTRPDRR